jgi:RNA polymerase sigma factor (sigma-70 family)
MATDDWQLLASYARERSQEAFARLVARYADFVFSCAQRRCRDRQVAEDVTQAVFIVLARNAARLKSSGSLAAWLHKTTLHASANAIRAESRRKRREQSTARREATTDTATDTPAPDTISILEQELHHLGEADRQVLAVRFLEDRTVAQTAVALGISIEATHKRISRALERLRTRLARRGTLMSAAGVASAAGSIAAAIPSQASAAHVASLAVAGGKSGAAFSLAAELIRMTRLAALQKAAALVTLGVGLVGAAIGVQASRRAEPIVASAPAATAPGSPSSPPATKAATSRPAIALPDLIRLALLENARQVGPIITVTWTSQARSQKSV